MVGNLVRHYCFSPVFSVRTFSAGCQYRNVYADMIFYDGYNFIICLSLRIFDLIIDRERTNMI